MTTRFLPRGPTKHMPVTGFMKKEKNTWAKQQGWREFEIFLESARVKEKRKKIKDYGTLYTLY